MCPNFCCFSPFLCMLLFFIIIIIFMVTSYLYYYYFFITLLPYILQWDLWICCIHDLSCEEIQVGPILENPWWVNKMDFLIALVPQTSKSLPSPGILTVTKSLLPLENSFYLFFPCLMRIPILSTISMPNGL